MTSAESGLPESVVNLRRIWNTKRIEEGFTQKAATANLGFTQGAISQYLNDITSLSPATTIKFANFLGVSPLDIDPTLIDRLPGVCRLRNYAPSSSTGKMKSLGTTLYKVNNDDSSFCVKIQKEAMIDGEPLPSWMIGSMLEISSRPRSTWALSGVTPKPTLFVAIHPTGNTCSLMSARNPAIRDTQLSLWSVVSIIPMVSIE